MWRQDRYRAVPIGMAEMVGEWDAGSLGCADRYESVTIDPYEEPGCITLVGTGSTLVAVYGC